MKRKWQISLLGSVLFLVLSSGPAFAQDKNIITGPDIEKAAPEEEIKWLWGEVQTIDVANNQVKVKFLDFESDTEKEITITANENTTFENIKSLAEVKPQDNLSIDYQITAQGSNVAKYIGLEKLENNQDTQNMDSGSSDVTPAVVMPETGTTSAAQESLPVKEEDVKKIPGY